MGFFSNLKGFFNDLTAKKKTIEEELTEEHDTSWYEENVSNALSHFLVSYEGEGQEAGINLFCLKYIGSFENVKYCQAQGMNIDVTMMAKEMFYQIMKAVREQEAQVNQLIEARRFFKEAESPYVRFAKKLNHNFYGETAFYISELIFLGYIDVDKDEWLYDKALFAYTDKDDENGSGLFEKVQAVLMEKGLLTEEIVAEIQASMQE